VQYLKQPDLIEQPREQEEIPPLPPEPIVEEELPKPVVYQKITAVCRFPYAIRTLNPDQLKEYKELKFLEAALETIDIPDIITDSNDITEIERAYERFLKIFP
jgi:hypothetical protein